jgi:hypothetical protein
MIILVTRKTSIMNNQNLKLLQDTFGDLSQVSTEKLRAFQSEIAREVFKLQALLESDNPEKRAEAIQQGETLKALLEEQMKSICEKLGLTPSDACAIAEVITGYKERKEKQKIADNESGRKDKKTINLIG